MKLSGLISCFSLIFSLHSVTSHIERHGYDRAQEAPLVKIVGIDQDRCTTNTDCRHGHCDQSTKKCTCDSGWTGRSCNEMTAYKNVAKSEAKDIKQNTQDEVTMYLADMFRKLGQHRRNRNRPFDIAANVVIRPTTENPGIKTLKEQDRRAKALAGSNPMENMAVDKNDRQEALAIELEEVDACSGIYNYKSHEERKCIGGLECEYGTCSAMNYGSYIAFECKCDKGAMGMLCEHRCCKNCGQNGRCDLYPDGTQFCFCKPGYYGYRCEFSFSIMEKQDHIPIVTTSTSLSKQLK